MMENQKISKFPFKEGCFSLDKQDEEFPDHVIQHKVIYPLSPKGIQDSPTDTHQDAPTDTARRNHCRSKCSQAINDQISASYKGKGSSTSKSTPAKKAVNKPSTAVSEQSNLIN